MDNNSSSGVNTILIVLILIILVGGGVWYFTSMRGAPAPAQEEGADFTIDVNLPAGGDPGGTDSGGGQ